ncbi:hypothetical protein IEO21_10064 [Rhodonia placenta]|uniref:Uncharacterized protein n=1 Tax=Rhodonia placenta TaxID=104341 RepID=A0A8H7NTA9_9APHY|nr:hypothetical protein IEO21_10064 [Postia placenta]
MNVLCTFRLLWDEKTSSPRFVQEHRLRTEPLP